MPAKAALKCSPLDNCYFALLRGCILRLLHTQRTEHGQDSINPKVTKKNAVHIWQKCNVKFYEMMERIIGNAVTKTFPMYTRFVGHCGYDLKREVEKRIPEKPQDSTLPALWEFNKTFKLPIGHAKSKRELYYGDYSNAKKCYTSNSGEWQCPDPECQWIVVNIYGKGLSGQKHL